MSGDLRYASQAHAIVSYIMKVLREKSDIDSTTLDSSLLMQCQEFLRTTVDLRDSVKRALTDAAIQSSDRKFAAVREAAMTRIAVAKAHKETEPHTYLQALSASLVMSVKSSDSVMATLKECHDRIVRAEYTTDRETLLNRMHMYRALHADWKKYVVILYRHDTRMIDAHNNTHDNDNSFERGVLAHITWDSLFTNRAWLALGIDVTDSVVLPTLGRYAHGSVPIALDSVLLQARSKTAGDYTADVLAIMSQYYTLHTAISMQLMELIDARVMYANMGHVITKLFVATQRFAVRDEDAKKTTWFDIFARYFGSPDRGRLDDGEYAEFLEPLTTKVFEDVQQWGNATFLPWLTVEWKSALAKANTYSDREKKEQQRDAVRSYVEQLRKFLVDAITDSDRKLSENLHAFRAVFVRYIARTIHAHFDTCIRQAYNDWLGDAKDNPLWSTWTRICMRWKHKASLDDRTNDMRKDVSESIGEIMLSIKHMKEDNDKLLNVLPDELATRDEFTVHNKMRFFMCSQVLRRLKRACNRYLGISSYREADKLDNVLLSYTPSHKAVAAADPDKQMHMLLRAIVVAGAGQKLDALDNDTSYTSINGDAFNLYTGTRTLQAHEWGKLDPLAFMTGTFTKDQEPRILATPGEDNRNAIMGFKSILIRALGLHSDSRVAIWRQDMSLFCASVSRLTQDLSAKRDGDDAMLGADVLPESEKFIEFVHLTSRHARDTSAFISQKKGEYDKEIANHYKWWVETHDYKQSVLFASYANGIRKYEDELADKADLSDYPLPNDLDTQWRAAMWPILSKIQAYTEAKDAPIRGGMRLYQKYLDPKTTDLYALSPDQLATRYAHLAKHIERANGRPPTSIVWHMLRLYVFMLVVQTTFYPAIV